MLPARNSLSQRSGQHSLSNTSCCCFCCRKLSYRGNILVVVHVVVLLPRCDSFVGQHGERATSCPTVGQRVVLLLPSCCLSVTGPLVMPNIQCCPALPPFRFRFVIMARVKLHEKYFIFRETKDWGLFLSASKSKIGHYLKIFEIKRSCPLRWTSAHREFFFVLLSFFVMSCFLTFAPYSNRQGYILPEFEVVVMSSLFLR